MIDQTNGNPLPDIIVDFRKMYDILSSPEAKEWYIRLSSPCKWLGHAVFMRLQSCFQARANASTKSDNVTMATNGDEVPVQAVSVYKVLVDMLVDDLNKVSAGAGNQVFSTEPFTYKLLRPNIEKPNKKQKTNTSNQQQQQQQQQSSNPRGHTGVNSGRPNQSRQAFGGFLVVRGRVRFPVLSGGIELCGNNSIIHRECPHGANCTRIHATYPGMNGVAADRTIIDNFVANNPGVSFAPNVENFGQSNSHQQAGSNDNSRGSNQNRQGQQLTNNHGNAQPGQGNQPADATARR
jgi:hypothetical protein